MKISLIDIEEYYSKTLLHDNINENKLQVLIERMQDSYIQSILGSELYNDLQTKKLDDTLNEYEQELINSYIAPCAFIELEINALYELNVEFRNLTTGTVIDGQIAPLQPEIINLIANEKKQAKALIETILIKYLKNNTDKFPLYSVSSENGIAASQDRTMIIRFL